MDKCGKISIGTAQFGMSYGMLNKYGQVSDSEALKILSVAQLNGIHSIDTSGDYGNSEKILGQIFAANPTLLFDIYTKNATSDITSSFHTSLNHFKTIKGYFVHYFKSYKQNPSIWEHMQELRNSGKVKRIGFSLYDPEELEFLLDKDVDFNLIQFPFNVFDRRFMPYFEILEGKGVQIQIRSIFLQGILFKDVSTLPEKLKPFGKYIESLQVYCRESNVEIEDLLLNYALSIPQISNVVLGVHTAKQLQSNINAVRNFITQHEIDFIESIHIKEQELLNPANWK